MSWDVEWLEYFQMLQKIMVHKGKENRALCNCSVIVMKYVLKYEYMINPWGYVVERIESKAWIWVRILSEVMNGNSFLESDVTKRKLYQTFCAGWQKKLYVCEHVCMSVSIYPFEAL